MAAGLSAIFLPDKLKSIRKQKGMRIAHIARRIDPDNEKSLGTSITGYEQGKNMPNAGILVLIAYVLDVSVTEFFEIRED